MNKCKRSSGAGDQTKIERYNHRRSSCFISSALQSRTMDTSLSLLESLRGGADQESWHTLVRIYGPLIRAWLTRHGARPSEIDDVVQEMLLVVVRRIPEFQHASRTGSFRSWLRTIAVNCLRDHWRRLDRQPAAAGGSDFRLVIEQLADPHSSVSQQWDREHDELLTRYLLERVREQVAPKHWQAFQRFVLDGLSADQVARELDMTANAVFIAKSRVMNTLRSLGRGLLDF